MSAVFAMQVLLVAAPVAPLVVAVVAWLARQRPATTVTARHAAEHTWLTPLAALPAVLVVLLVPDGTVVTLPWLLQTTVLGIDPIGRVFLGFTGALWLASGWYARAALARDANELRFHLFFLVSMAGNFGLVVAEDVSTFYVCFAIMGFASAGLVLHRGDAEATRAAKIYVALAVVGETLILAGFAYLVTAAGTTRIDALQVAPVHPAGLVCLLVGFGIKAGALSLHFWLPLAHPAAPVPASAVLSGAMIKAGLLGWIRFLPLGVASLPFVGLALVAAGAAAALLGTVAGMTQRNPKTVLAYSSISQMGIITVGVGTALRREEAWATILPAILIYATHHALAKGALFLGVSPAHAARTTAEVLWARTGILVAALALAGAPFTSGAVAKLALKSNVDFLPGAWATWLAVILPIAAAGTTLKMARFAWLVWPRRHDREERRGATAGARGTWMPWSVMVIAVVIGVWTLPGSWQWLSAKLTPEKLWLATWPLLAGSALALVVAMLRRIVPERLAARGFAGLPAGDVLVLAESLVRRLRGRPVERPPAEPMGPTVAETIRERAKAAACRAADRLQAAERALRAWPVVGVSLVGVMAVVTLLLRS